MSHVIRRLSMTMNSLHFTCFLCLYLFISLGESHSQTHGTTGHISDKIDPSRLSPTAASFNSYVDYPEISNSGQVGVHAPIYKLKDKDLTLDIQLNYNMSGIKVDSRSTWVGTGWNLQAGGIITREVKDLPDDARYLITHLYQSINSPRASLYVGWLDADDVNNAYGGPDNKMTNFPNIPAADGTTTRKAAYAIQALRMNSLSNGMRDFEPDIFTFNMNGKSFKFLFNEEGEPRILGLNDYKIEYFRNNGQEIVNEILPGGYESVDFNDHIIKFVVTDPQGFRYTFDEVEYTTITNMKFALVYRQTAPVTHELSEIASEPEKQPYHPTAWHLSKIESPAGNEMNFSYTTALISEKPKISDFLGFCQSGDCATDENRNKFKLMDDAPEFDRRSLYEISGKFLNKITTDNIEVRFISHANRKDLTNAPELNEIQVFYRPTTRRLYRYSLGLGISRVRCLSC